MTNFFVRIKRGGERRGVHVKSTQGLVRFSDKAFAMLKGRMLVGGLELTDATLRLVHATSKKWEFFGVRLPPEVLRKGEIKDRTGFVEALATLRRQVAGGTKRMVTVTVAVAPGPFYYSRVFKLPLLTGAPLEDAVKLNLDMFSPYEAGRVYTGWQIVGKDEAAGRLEVLSCFTDRARIDALESALAEAGFVIVAVEPRALALARSLRSFAQPFDPAAAYLVVHVDNEGLELLFVRHGELYFDYHVPWQDLGGKEFSTMRAFVNAIAARVRQVLTFYGTHWGKDPLGGACVVAHADAAAALETAIQEGSAGKLEVRMLSLEEGIPAQWFVAVGAGLRTLTPRREDRELSLTGISAREMFAREQWLVFLRLWRVVIPSALAILFIVFVLAETLLVEIGNSLAERLREVGGESSVAAQTLEESAREFNEIVSLLAHVLPREAAAPFIERLHVLGSMNGVKITRLSFGNAQVDVSLAGSAASEQQILAFKRALETEGSFKTVTLPLTGLKAGPQGISFSMTLARISSKTE